MQFKRFKRFQRFKKVASPRKPKVPRNDMHMKVGNSPEANIRDQIKERYFYWIPA